ncbi:DUF2798 domain-containing protein [Psychrosphaera algicola]
MLSVMSILVGTITAIMTLANLQPSQPFLSTWVSSFIFALLVMLPIGATIFTVLSKLINLYLPTWSVVQKNLLQGAFMALIMESIMAVVTIISGHNYASLTQFVGMFFNSLVYALPVGLTFSCLMTLVIKPRIEKMLANEATA